jgi:hypothetical protein
MKKKKAAYEMDEVEIKEAADKLLKLEEELKDSGKSEEEKSYLISKAIHEAVNPEHEEFRAKDAIEASYRIDTYKVKAAKLHEAVRVGTINRGWVEANDKISLEYNPSHQVLIIRGKGIQNEAWGTGKTIQVQVPVTNVPFMVIAED